MLRLLYRKIPNISPGLIEVRKYFLGVVYSGGLIFGGKFVLVNRGAYIQGLIFGILQYVFGQRNVDPM